MMMMALRWSDPGPRVRSLQSGVYCQQRSFFQLLFCLFLTSIQNGFARIHYITSTNVYRDCGDICGYKGYDCNSNHLQAMSCKEASTDICGKMLTSDNNNFFQCTYGGCFVNCDYGVYSDKSSSDSSCSSKTDCYNRQGAPQFSKICACESDESVALTVWQIIGIATGVFFFFSTLCALLMYFYLEYSLKQEYKFSRIDDDGEDGKGEKDSKDKDKEDGKVWSERYGKCKDCCCSSWTAFALMVTAACAACYLCCRGGGKDNSSSSSSPDQDQDQGSGRREKKEKKSWLKLKYGRKEKKKAPEPTQGGWYKEGGLPSAYEKPVVKEKKKYSYDVEFGEEDESDEDQRLRKRIAEKDRVLSTYTEYQENSTDQDQADRRDRRNGMEMRKTSTPATATATATVTAPPPLLSQRRNSLSNPSSSTSSQAAPSPSYQPKPIQAASLSSSQRTTNPMISSDHEASDSHRSHRSQSKNPAPVDSSPPAAVWQAGGGKVVKVNRRDQGYNWDAESHLESSAVSDSSVSDLSRVSSDQQTKGRRIRGGNI